MKTAREREIAGRKGVMQASPLPPVTEKIMTAMVDKEGRSYGMQKVGFSIHHQLATCNSWYCIGGANIHVHAHSVHVDLGHINYSKMEF